MQRRLIWKVMAMNFPVIVLVIGVIWWPIEYLAADYLMELMNEYQISPDHIHGMFLDSIHRYLVWASSAAILLAALVSYVLSYRVLRPLKEVSQAIHKMSNGDRDVRARTFSNDELGELAEAFNLMAAKVKEAENLQENMVIDLAHELRTPISNIRGYVEGLQDGIITPNNKTLSILEKEALRLGELVEGLLDLSRADAAKFNLSVRPLNIYKAIKIALDTNTQIIRKKDLTINVEVADDAQHVTADREKLQIVLGIFLQNASQYSPEGSVVTIRCTRQNYALHLSMTNPCETLSSDDLRLVFERFYRAEKSRSRNNGGAGIGLAIVKKLVDADGGSVGASSDGGRFTVWITIPNETKPPNMPIQQS